MAIILGNIHGSVESIFAIGNARGGSGKYNSDRPIGPLRDTN